MGNFRPLPVKCFEAFLIANGFIKDRISASHHIWTKKGVCRSVVIQGNEKEVPAFHLRTNCRTIGCTLDQMYSWAEDNG